VQQSVVDNSRANRPLEEERCSNGVPANGRLGVRPEHAFGPDHPWKHYWNSRNGVADARNSQPDTRHGEPYSGNSYSSAGNSSGNDAYESNTRNYAHESDSREYAE
jgi:hypothetical protein